MNYYDKHTQGVSELSKKETVAVVVLTSDNWSDVDYYVGKTLSPEHLVYADQIYQFVNKRRGVKKFTEDIFKDKKTDTSLSEVVEKFAISKAKREGCTATIHPNYAFLTKEDVKKIMKGETA